MNLLIKSINRREITTLLISAFAFSLPFKNLPVLFGSLILLWSVSEQITDRKFKIKFNMEGFLLFLILIITPVSLLYSEDVREGTHYIGKRIFLLFPFFLTSFHINKTQLDKILKSFVGGNLLTVIICLSFAVYRSFSIVNGEIIFDAVVMEKDISFEQSITWGGNYFFYSDLALYMHPSYLAMQVLLSALISYYLLLNSQKIIYTVLIFIFSLFIFMLSSRANILAFVIIILLIFVSRIVKIKKIKYKIMLISTVLALFGIMLLNPRFKGIKFDDIKKANARIMLWETSIHIIKDNIWFGVGSGSVDKATERAYKELEINQKINNSHNQFLQSFVEHGLIGGGALLTLFLSMFIKSIKQKKTILFFFIIIMGTNFMFESMLNRILGSQFFGFWSGVLVLYPFRKDEEIEKI